MAGNSLQGEVPGPTVAKPPGEGKSRIHSGVMNKVGGLVMFQPNLVGTEEDPFWWATLDELQFVPPHVDTTGRTRLTDEKRTRLFPMGVKGQKVSNNFVFARIEKGMTGVSLLIPL